MTDKALALPTTRQVWNAAVDRRLQRRQKAFRPAVIVIDGKDQRLHLLDLTTEGALAYAYDPPGQGAPCWLLLLDQRVRAEVIWTDDRKFGLRFAKPLTAALVDQLLIVG